MVNVIVNIVGRITANMEWISESININGIPGRNCAVDVGAPTKQV